MAKLIKRTITAGPLVMEAIYPAPHPRDSMGVRQGKKALSSAAQQRMNLKYAYQRLELLIAANFRRGDLWCTFTYDDEHLPKNRKESIARMSAFMKRLRALRKPNGSELVYIYNTEHKHGDGRWHHHVLLNNVGEAFEEIAQLWGQGLVFIRPLRVDKQKHFESLARYLCKEYRDGVGDRMWTCSRNLKKPERDCCRVDEVEAAALAAPEGSLIFEDSGQVVTAYGRYRFIKYLDNGWQRAVRPRRARRRAS